MKLIHCADIHLDSKLSANLEGDKRKKRKNEILESFINMVMWAAQNHIDGIIIAGDLFDTSSISKTTASYVRNCITDNPQITFYYLKGNHDVHSFLYGMYGAEDEYPNLKLFGEEWTEYALNEAGSIVLKGVELTSGNCESIYNSLVLNPGAFNIVTLHGQNSMYQAKDKTEVISLSSMKNKSIDYLALGHVHRYEEGKLDNRGIYVYPGCLEGRGFDECGIHGFVELTIDDDTLEFSKRFVPWGKRRLYEIEADMGGCRDTVEAVSRVRKAIDESGALKEDLIKVIIKGEVDSETDINADFIMHQLTDEYFYIKVQDSTRIKMKYSDYAGDISLKGEFIRLVMGSSDLSDDDKAQIIKTGLLALRGEEF